MICSSVKTLQLLLLVLTLSTLSTSIAAADYTKQHQQHGGVASIRGGRILQEMDDDLEETTTTTIVPMSADDEDESAASEIEEASVEGEEPSVDDSEDGEMSSRSGVIAPTKRKCTTEQSKGSVNFECKASTEDGISEIKDKIKFKVGATKGDFLKIKVEYENEIEDVATEMESEVETQYTLVYDRIIEYRKASSSSTTTTGGDDHYEWGVDQVVAEWKMDTWDNLSALATDGNLLTFSASDGVATFTFTIAQSDSMDLTTNKMKIDFLLENYPWDASGDTFVALISHIETERKTKIDGEDGSDSVSEVLIDFQEAVDTAGFIPFGDYTWETTAEATVFSTSGGAIEDVVINGTTDTTGEVIAVERMADGDNTTNTTGTVLKTSGDITTTVSVIASSAPANPDLDYTEIAFSFVGAAQGADRIYWDPEAGVGYGSSAARVAGFAAASMVVVASSFLALVW